MKDFAIEIKLDKLNKHYRKCKNQNKPCIWVRPAKKGNWCVEIDMITVNHYRLSESISNELFNTVEREIQIDISSNPPLLTYDYYIFSSKEKAVDFATIASDIIMDEEKWVKVGEV